MTDCHALLSGALDLDFIQRHTLRLHELERSTSNRDFQVSTAFVMQVMREVGFEHVERYALPCDGETTYDDCTMPLAWDRTGRSTLEILDDTLPPQERFLVDTDREPLGAVIWSPPTPPGGIQAELADLHAAASADWHEFRGKIVLCDRSPNGDLLRRLAASGAVGLVSYIGEILATNPDDVRWMNGVGLCGWYYRKEDPMLWNFSIPPRRGAALAERLRRGERIRLKAVMATRVYPGEIYTVTGLIPGRSRREVALFAHMYEPFLADDSAGVILSVAIGKALRELTHGGALPQLSCGIRVVFSMERYGYSEFFHRQEYASRIQAAMNMDSVCHRTWRLAGIPLELRHSPASAPFFGEVLLREALRQHFPDIPFRETPGNLSDDTFGADTPFDIPTGWLHTPPAPNRHHNTGEVFGGIDWEMAAMAFQVIGAYFAEIATAKRGAELTRLVRRVRRGVMADASADFRRLAAQAKSGEVPLAAVRAIGAFLVEYHTGRMAAINRIHPRAVLRQEARQALRTIGLRLAPVAFRRVVPRQMTKGVDDPVAALGALVVRRADDARQLMSLAKVPAPQRYGIARRLEMLLCALLDGRRTLYQAWAISCFMLRKALDQQDALAVAQAIRALSAYGYFKVASK